jgi:hypothetical protein
MAQENKQPSEALELSNQELDSIAGGAVSDTAANTQAASDSQFSFARVNSDGSIVLFNAQESIFSENELAELNSTNSLQF